MIIEQSIPSKTEVEIILEGASRVETDERLASAVCGGSRDALEELYDRHVQQCFGLSLRILGSNNAAEEVVHDVFTRFWADPHSYPPGHGLFSVRLLSAVYREAVQVRCRAGGQTRADAQMQAQMCTQTQAQTWTRETTSDYQLDRAINWSGEAVRLHSQLQTLSGLQGQVMALFFFDGLTCEEIAEGLNEQPGTIAQQLRLVIRQLAGVARS